MSIAKQTNDVLKNAIKNFAKENEIENKGSQILICSNDVEDCVPIYKVLKNNKVLKEVSFNEILNVKFDFLGREILATPFISNTLKRLARENNCKPDEINIVAYTEDEEAKEVLLYCFIGNTPHKRITMDDVFAQLT